MIPQKPKELIFIFLTLFCFPQVFWGQIEVCPTCDYKQISSAIEKAQEGDTILVKKEVYQENNIEIDKPLTLLAEKGTVIDGKDKGEVIRIMADDVTVDGFEIKNIGRSQTKDHAAIRVRKVKRFLIQNLLIRKPFFAIYLQRGEDGVVRNNRVLGDATSEFTSGNGIHLWKSKNNKLERNQLSGMRDGIYCEFSDENYLNENISRNNVRYGMHFMFSEDNHVENSTYLENGAGIAIMFSKRFQLNNNTFKDNWGSASYGVLLKEVVDAEINHNIFDRNTAAIQIEGSNRIKYTHNDFQSNGWAVNSRGGNYSNIFYKNNFLDNSFDLAYKGGINDNSFDGNYWSEYSGYDINRDGVGDVPYRPVKLFSYLVNKSPEAIILLRSAFIDLVDFAEKVSPVFTPDKLLDNKPYMKQIKHD